MISAFLQGFILALGLIMPLGVQNIFIFNQGASQPSFLRALPSVLTAFICDSLLILLAVLGVSLIVLKIAWLKTIIFAVGAGFLFYMGWSTWHKSKQPLQASKPYSIKQQIVFTVSVSILNPHAIIDSVSVIGSASLVFSGDAKISFTTACILVSLLWFCTMAIAGRTLHKFDNNGLFLRYVNKFSALIMWSVGAYMIWQLVKIFYA